jgi:hypothetical protein
MAERGANPGERRLRVARRRVAPAARAEHRRAWRRLESAVSAAGGRAWIFESAAEPGEYLEFVEWQGAAGALPAGPAVAAALGALESSGESTIEEWKEAADE